LTIFFRYIIAVGDGCVSDASPLLLQWTSSHVTEHRCSHAFLNKLLTSALPLLRVMTRMRCLQL
jgi:hypothetical protein